MGGELRMAVDDVASPLVRVRDGPPVRRKGDPQLEGPLDMKAAPPYTSTVAYHR